MEDQNCLENIGTPSRVGGNGLRQAKIQMERRHGRSPYVYALFLHHNNDGGIDTTHAIATSVICQVCVNTE